MVGGLILPRVVHVPRTSQASCHFLYVVLFNETRQFVRNTRVVGKFTFPDDQHAPPFSAERADVLYVALNRTSELLFPKSGVGTGT